MPAHHSWCLAGRGVLDQPHQAPTIHAFPVSTSCVTDAELVARARTGDHAAFGDLVDRHRTAVYRAALTALRSHAEAEDAAQDAFVLAWRRLGSFRGDASFKTWLLTIAWHQAINRRRGLMGRWRRMIPFEDVTVRLTPDTTYAEQSAPSATSDGRIRLGPDRGARPNSSWPTSS